MLTCTVELNDFTTVLTRKAVAPIVKSERLIKSGCMIASKPPNILLLLCKRIKRSVRV